MYFHFVFVEFICRNYFTFCDVNIVNCDEISTPIPINGNKYNSGKKDVKSAINRKNKEAQK